MGDIWPEVSRIGAKQSYVTGSLSLKPECPASEAKCSGAFGYMKPNVVAS